jgi:hypothetical protein
LEINVDDILKEYEDLWTKSKHEYAQVKLVGKNNVTYYLIRHLSRGTWIIIEDDNIRPIVVQKMLEAGVEILTEFPKATTPPQR